MARILFTWELGGGIGHVAPHAPVIAGLLERGHDVYFALRHVDLAARVFEGNDVRVLQAPINERGVTQLIEPACSYPQILHNVGYGDPVAARVRANAWRNLVECIGPDLLVADHSPTALLASRGLALKKAIVGVGFAAPPNEHPLPPLRPWLNVPTEQLLRDESRVLATMNSILENWKQPPLEQIGQLFADADACELLTFAEFDPYPRKSPPSYRGAWPGQTGNSLTWPAGDGPRIYAYLEWFAGAPALLSRLSELGCPTVIVPRGESFRVWKPYASATLHFSDRLLDMEAVGRECDLAIIHGNHATTVGLLLAGVPQLLIPIHLEQYLLARAVQRMGAGLAAPADAPQRVLESLGRLLDSDGFQAQAQAFAGRHVDFDPSHERELLTNKLDELTGR